MADNKIPDICDYEDSTYRTDFWEGKGREYEDRAERVAIDRLMPKTGRRIVELGAGFGRLGEMYKGYEQIVLFDYSRSQLEFARQTYGDEGFLYVAGNIYNLPFAPGVFDTVTMVRVLHHMEDAPAALSSIRAIMHSGSVFVMEFANKRNIKAVGRWLLGRQKWNPFSLEPVEFVDLNFDFHPNYVRGELANAQFKTGRWLTVSHFRIALLKRLVPTGILVALDSLAQLTGNLWQLSPSVFTRNEAVGDDVENSDGAFWRCPSCGSLKMHEVEQRVDCSGCGTKWLKHNGVYDFKEPENT